MPFHICCKVINCGSLLFVSNLKESEGVILFTACLQLDHKVVTFQEAVNCAMLETTMDVEAAMDAFDTHPDRMEYILQRDVLSEDVLTRLVSFQSKELKLTEVALKRYFDELDEIDDTVMKRLLSLLEHFQWPFEGLSILKEHMPSPHAIRAFQRFQHNPAKLTETAMDMADYGNDSLLVLLNEQNLLLVDNVVFEANIDRRSRFQKLMSYDHVRMEVDFARFEKKLVDAVFSYRKVPFDRMAPFFPPFVAPNVDQFNVDIAPTVNAIIDDIFSEENEKQVLEQLQRLELWKHISQYWGSGAAWCRRMALALCRQWYQVAYQLLTWFGPSVWTLRRLTLDDSPDSPEHEQDHMRAIFQVSFSTKVVGIQHYQSIINANGVNSVFLYFKDLLGELDAIETVNELVDGVYGLKLTIHFSSKRSVKELPALFWGTLDEVSKHRQACSDRLQAYRVFFQKPLTCKRRWECMDQNTMRINMKNGGRTHDKMCNYVGATRRLPQQDLVREVVVGSIDLTE